MSASSRPRGTRAGKLRYVGSVRVNYTWSWNQGWSEWKEWTASDWSQGWSDQQLKNPNEPTENPLDDVPDDVIPAKTFFKVDADEREAKKARTSPQVTSLVLENFHVPCDFAMRTLLEIKDVAGEYWGDQLELNMFRMKTH